MTSLFATLEGWRGCIFPLLFDLEGLIGAMLRDAPFACFALQASALGFPAMTFVTLAIAYVQKSCALRSLAFCLLALPVSLD